MKKIIFNEKAPAPIGPYNQAVLINDVLYTSGQIALNPTTMDLVLENSLHLSQSTKIYTLF